MTKKSSSSSSTAKVTPETYLIICCGFPGSGKSTFSEQLEKKSTNFVRVNQDTLGDASECKKVMEKSFKHNKSVILDRCNIHPKDRLVYLLNNLQ